MSPGRRAEELAVAVDSAEARAASVGRSIAEAAGELDSVAQRLGGGAAADRGWEGHAGRTARGRVGDAAAGARVLSGNCLFLADVLRVEGARLARAVIHWSDDERAEPGNGDATEVGDADRALAVRLREAADSLAGYTDAATRACIDLTGSTGDDPRAVADLWHALGPADRERLARDNPGLGSVAGLSSATRDALNRTRLNRMLETAEAETAESGSAEPGSAEPGGAAGAAREVDADTRRGLESLAAHLAEDPARHLLVLHADGRAVVASADPDGADRVVTLVPGTGSSLESIDRTGERGSALCAEAEEAAAGSCVAVSWQGYDAPDDAAAAGLSAGPARAHAADLRTLSAGLDEVERMDGEDSPHTAVGYSYGSAVVGAAAADPRGLAADRMIHVGSAGATVDSIAQQVVDEGGTARPAERHEVAGVASRWDPVPWWSITRVLGERPGTAGFGGLAVDVTEPGSGPESIRTAHSRYFDPGTVSLEEIGRLVADTN